MNKAAVVIWVKDRIYYYTITADKFKIEHLHGFTTIQGATASIRGVERRMGLRIRKWETPK